VAITTALNLGIVTSDGGGSTATKQVTGLSFTGINDMYIQTQAVGVTAPAQPAPTTLLAVPGTVTPTGSTTGGTLAAATYFYKVTALNAVGETTGSAEASVTTTGTTSSVALAWTAVASAASYKVYRGTAAAGENVFYTTATNSYTDTGAVSTAGTVPTSNTTGTAGSVAVGTYFVKVTYVNAPQGESLPSPESVQITALASSSIVVPSPPASAAAAAYNVYITAANGATNTETKQNTSPVPIGTNYTQSAAITAGAAMPGSNTTLNYTFTLPQSPAQAVYLRNLTAVGGASMAVTWTPQGGASVKTLDLVPQAAILFLEPVAGNGVGGITALSVAALSPVVLEAKIDG
jgi:hypothetical protein